MRTSSPFWSMDAVLKTALYSMPPPKPMLPMIAASSPVTSNEVTVKMPSLTPAAMVVEFRLIRLSSARTTAPYINGPRAP